MEGSWDLLSCEIHSEIVSYLWKDKDRSSLQALMQTSTQLRMLVSQLRMLVRNC